MNFIYFATLQHFRSLMHGTSWGAGIMSFCVFFIQGYPKRLCNEHHVGEMAKANKASYQVSFHLFNVILP
jgi:hypothetical protein